MKNYEHKIESGIELKYCSSCKSWLPLSCFFTDNTKRDHLGTPCKSCYYIKSKERREKKKLGLFNDVSLSYTHKIIDGIEKKYCTRCANYLDVVCFTPSRNRKDFLRIWCRSCKSKQRKENIERVRITAHNLYERDKERIKEKNKQYLINHPNFSKEQYIRWKSSPTNRLSRNFSSSISSVLRGKKGGVHCFDLVPYTLEDLKRHLESLWEPWMNWGNYGKGPGCWAIDHKRPVVSFTFVSPKDLAFQECWSLNNLRPLCYIENSKKSGYWKGKRWTRKTL